MKKLVETVNGIKTIIKTVMEIHDAVTKILSAYAEKQKQTQTNKQ